MLDIMQLENENPLIASQEEYPDLEKRFRILTESELLTPSQAKKVIRETQNELSSAWKFYMGLGMDKQALILVDGFTTLPLSLARNCEQVVIYGLKPTEVALIKNLAANKKISNFICVNELNNLATQFDIILFSISRHSTASSIRLAQEVRKFIHAKTEFWILTTNEFSIGSAKRFVNALVDKFRRSEKKKKGDRQEAFRFQYGLKPLVPSRQVKLYLNSIGCQPFVEVGILPSMTHMRHAQPVKDERIKSKNGYLLSPLQKIGAREIAIGATPSKAHKSFLDRLLSEVPASGLKNGELQKYHISSSGKVLLFAKFHEQDKDRQVLIKLPLNELSQNRLYLNQKILKFLANSEGIGESRRMYFPEPVAEGSFEKQIFFIESILDGKSGDQLKISRRDRESLVHQIFAFWIGVQTSLIRPYYIDGTTFDEFFEAPLRRIFELTGRKSSGKYDYKEIASFLEKIFLQRDVHLSMIHGDFSLKNIILDENLMTLRGIVDWDMAREVSFPVLDVLHFFVRNHRQSFKKSPLMLISQFIAKPEVDVDFQRILQIYEERFHVEKWTLPAYLIIYWIQRISAHLGTMKMFDEPFMKRNFDDALAHIYKIMSRTKL